LGWSEHRSRRDMLRAVSNLDALTEDELHAHLKAQAQERGERFYVEESEDEWLAQFRVPNRLAGEVIPVDEGAMVLPGENVHYSINGRDRRTAMVRRAKLLAGEYG